MHTQKNFFFIKILRQILLYIRHLLQARNSYGHGVHSPFLYSFTQNVIYGTNDFYIFNKIEKQRKTLQQNNTTINFTDFGAGKKKQARISEIAKTSLKRKKWAQILYRIVNFSSTQNALELGTSLGITTAYIASVNSQIKCISLEGSEEIANIAHTNLKKLDITNAYIKVGNIDKTLNKALAEIKKVDFVFFDANHRKEPTLKYFTQCLQLTHQNTIFVFDDIYWSKEMNQAWEIIKKHELVTSTIDLFEIGIVFFNKNLPKKNFKMAR